MQIQSRVRLLMPGCSRLIGNGSKLTTMPMFLQLPRTAVRVEIKPGGCIIGRNEMSLCRCPSAMFVSRHHCKLQLQADAKLVQLVHLANNPTLVITADNDTLLLKQGDSVMLSAGDSFSMLADKPSEAIQLTWEEPQQQQQQHQQQDLVHAQHDKRSREREHADSQPIVTQQQQQLQQQQRQLEGIAMQQSLPEGKHVVPKQSHQLQAEQQQQQQQQQSWSHQQQQQQQLGQQREAAGAAAAAAVSSAVAATANPGQQAQHLLAGQRHTAVAATPAAAAAAAAAAGPVGSSCGPVMLVLVGLPGSGKSTFAGELSSLSHQSWVRVNQDTIRGGKRGTREQCMAAAKTAIQAGSNVMVDRCNIDASQRSHFLQLGQQLGVSVHCVVLDLGTGVCMKRAAARIDHEGGVQGKAANRVVGQMNAQYKKAGPPSSSEGFVSLTICTIPEQVAAALQHWAAAAVGSSKPAASQQQHQQQVVTAVTAESCEPPLKKARVEAAAAAPAATSRQQADPTQQQQQQRQQRAGSTVADANAFQLLMQGAKQQQQQQQQSPAGKNQTPKSRSVASPITAAAAAAAGVGGGGSSHCGSWSSALTAITLNPDQYRSSAGVWHIDEQVVGIVDKYPKARHHALLLARQQGLHKVADLRGPQHLGLLAHMRQTALDWIQQQQQQQQQRQQRPSGAGDPHLQQASSQQQQQQQQQQQEGSLEVPSGWRIGFHSIPSMDQLHCHVISTDYDSDAMKNKKHWNSFTSRFFLDLDAVVQQLEGPAGRMLVDAADAEQLLKAPLRCHVCQQQLKNMPELKQHIKTHL